MTEMLQDGGRGQQGEWERRGPSFSEGLVFLSQGTSVDFFFLLEATVLFFLFSFASSYSVMEQLP